MIQADSTLIDTKAFQIQEGRITQLEKEKVLKDELIKKQNIFNYVLSGFILFVLVFLFFIAKALYSIKKKNKRIALQSLRREMNPHFIFNSLNSVNQFIAQNNELEANKYLSSYSKLMRNVMENSNKDFIPLSAEIEQLKEYLELEYMRFHDKFRYEINIDKDLDTDAVSIPNMLIQPQLENAVWHGLRYSEANGLLTLTVKNDGNKLSVIIEDNGIGIKRSNELKTKHQREHKSRGLTNTQERISLLNSLYNIDIFMEIKDKTADETGVIVMFSFPFLNKKLL
nr:histidine kinase [Dysgonomonas sp. 520]